ncbi:hypothetical protein [Pantoea sp. B65]|uniref:hypothetical protein n=1 Tax=Pantoea sp. B65 TaxID=2813359 RepID=UPI0039B4C80A
MTEIIPAVTSWEDVALTTKSWWVVIIYYAVSLIIFVFIYQLGLAVERRWGMLMFSLVRAFIVYVGAIQASIYFYGLSTFFLFFLHDMFPASVFLNDYDSIRYTAFGIAWLYTLAAPEKWHVEPESEQR